ncbi:NfeD family protein [Roseomonas populi]|uniref:NfeD family protein n=1 Tax=Roseomonas populi TaxID=3121582 RepID=A0ABT1X804_9PROT|nr:NfeD family protein [Roseomonas pecuniae]MCR0984235.1 NfeD family protein [Roseomonas pecuniae]
MIWLLAGLLLLGAEMILPGAFLLWAGIAAVGTGLLGLAVEPGFPLSVVVFAVLLAAGIALALRRRRVGGASGLNTPESGLVGRDGVVLPSAGPGLRVRVGDSDWAARAEGAVPAAGAVVRVEAVEGTVLRVKAAG